MLREIMQVSYCMKLDLPETKDSHFALTATGLYSVAQPDVAAGVQQI